MVRIFLPIFLLGLLSLSLLAGSPKSNPFRSAEPKVVPVAEGDQAFQQGHFREAAEWYAEIAKADPKVLSDGQKNAWAFCRIRLAAEALASPVDAKRAARIEKEVVEAMTMAPGNKKVQRLGQAVLVLARQSRGAAVPPVAVAPKAPAPGTSSNTQIETANFVVKFSVDRETAQKVAQEAEQKRLAIFKRWSGPPGGAWSPRCEIVLHDSAGHYAAATRQQVASTGHATVKLARGKAIERRIDLRLDDEGLLANTLPRELTHVVLADLFPFTPPPKWAEEGMAVLAESPEEISRYLRTCVTCGRQGQLFTLVKLLEMKEFPAADKITGFCCGSVSLVEYMVKLKGEKHFTTFLRDCQRYGSGSALKRQYDVESPQTLQKAWLIHAVR